MKNMDVSIFERYMKCPIILDGRNCFDPEQFRTVHVIYDSIGRDVVDYLYLDR